jgi:16S rRNA G966 N2-methylase RsmD
MTEAYGDALKRLDDRRALRADCLIVMERRADSEVKLPEGFEAFDTRRYGETAVDFVRTIPAL